MSRDTKHLSALGSILRHAGRGVRTRKGTTWFVAGAAFVVCAVLSMIGCPSHPNGAATPKLSAQLLPGGFCAGCPASASCYNGICLSPADVEEETCGPNADPCTGAHCSCVGSFFVCGPACFRTGGSCTSIGDEGCRQFGTLECDPAHGISCSAKTRTSGPCSPPAGGMCNANGSCVLACPPGTSRCTDHGECLPIGQSCQSGGTGGCSQSGAIVCGPDGTMQCNAGPRTSGPCANGGTCGPDGTCLAPLAPEILYQLKWYHQGPNYSNDLCFPWSGTADGKNVHELPARSGDKPCPPSPCGSNPQDVRYGDCQVAHIAGHGTCGGSGNPPSGIKLGWASSDPTDCACVMHVGANIAEWDNTCQVTVMRASKAAR